MQRFLDREHIQNKKKSQSYLKHREEEKSGKRGGEWVG